MKTKKLILEQLKVKSFVTNMNKANLNAVNGGIEIRPRFSDPYYCKTNFETISIAVICKFVEP